MYLKNLIKGSPRNIRNRLFRDIILIIILAVFAISILALVQGVSTKDKVSAQLIAATSTILSKKIARFLEPFDNSLLILSQMSQVSGFDISEPETLKALFIPFLNTYKNLTRLTLVKASGESLSLYKDSNGYTLAATEGAQAHPLLLSRSYLGAITAPENKPVFWSGTFTSNHKESGISASIKITLPETGKDVVAILFIPAKDLLSFISDIDIEEHVDIILYNKEGLFISRNQILARDNQPPGSQALQLNRKLPEIEAAVKLGNDNKNNGKQVKKFNIEGNTWWAGYSSLDTIFSNARVSVIVPEKDIIDDVQRQWLKLGSFVGIILLIAFFMTLNLVRKYSSQLKDLPYQNILKSNLAESILTLIGAGESSSLEFKSTMRKNLKTGKTGKEIEIAWLKTIVAFMNSDGGVLLIGVNDNGVIIGIKEDEFANEDKCRLHFKNLVNAHIGAAFARYITLKICNFKDKDILVIECERVRKPVFLTIGKTEDFFIRSGPSSMKLTMSQLISYISERFF